MAKKNKGNKNSSSSSSSSVVDRIDQKIERKRRIDRRNSSFSESMNFEEEMTLKVTKNSSYLNTLLDELAYDDDEDDFYTR